MTLPVFLNLSLNVCSPCQVLGDVYTEVLVATHPLHRGPTDHKRGVGRCCLFLKSTISSLVLLTFRERQLSWHHDVSLSTSSKYAVSLLLLMRPRTTVSSANLTIEVELWEDTQLCVNLWTLVSKWNTKLALIWKRTLDHWVTVQFFFSLAQVRRLWWQL